MDSESEYHANVSLRDCLVQAAQGRELDPRHLPRQIDLGEFGREADRLLQRSASDPEHPEFASLGMLDAQGRVLLLKEPIRGEQGHVPVPAAKDKRRLLLLHSHGDLDAPFSPEDLEALLLPHTDSKATPAVLLVTPSTKLLVLRTSQTPQLPPAYILDASVMFRLQPAMAQEGELFDRLFAAHPDLSLDEHPPLATPDKQRLQQLSAKRMYALTRFAQEFALAAYSTKAVADTIVSRAW